MDRREELKQLYKDSETEAGIYQIKNTRNQKIFIVSSMNLRTINGRRFELQMGIYKNKMLQNDWNEFGEEGFAFEVLETVDKKKCKGYSEVKEQLVKLEEKWLNKLQPYGERGYNIPKEKEGYNGPVLKGCCNR
ncbi:MAG: GIY-YIG nuclease family protein [Firmicutes bacterium]|nr:GIY-YIG nuclease family protein [Bacillota bacterium]